MVRHGHGGSVVVRGRTVRNTVELVCNDPLALPKVRERCYPEAFRPVFITIRAIRASVSGTEGPASAPGCAVVSSMGSGEGNDPKPGGRQLRTRGGRATRPAPGATHKRERQHLFPLHIHTDFRGPLKHPASITVDYVRLTLRYGLIGRYGFTLRYGVLLRTRPYVMPSPHCCFTLQPFVCS